MRQSFGILFIAAVVVGFGFRTQAQNEGNALVLDVYSANIISKEIGERAFLNWGYTRRAAIRPNKQQRTGIDRSISA